MKKQYTDAEKQAYKEKQNEEMKSYKEQLVAGVEAFKSTDAYRAYLETASLFHNYSFYNTMMIHMQNPCASHVAGFTTWKKAGRYVKKGEKGIRIFAPLTYKVESKNADDEEARILRGFKLVSVFDITQTEGNALPEIAHELEDGIASIGQFASGISRTAGVQVTFEPITAPGVNGWCEPATGKVVIRDDMSKTQQVKTLLHEAAHYILHKSTDLSQDAKELQAESTAYIVLRHFGIDASNYSFGYLASWSAGASLKEFDKLLTPALEAAGKLIDGIEKGMKKCAQRAA